jgi:plastocyanin
MLRWTLVLAAAALVAAGCGGGSSSEKSSSSGAASATKTSTSTATPAAGGGGAAAVPVAADPGGALKFTTKTLSAKAGKVTFKFANKAQVPHALAIEGHGVDAKTAVVTGGDASLTVNLKPGTYEFYCPVDGHKAAGMEGTLTVK